MPNRDAVVWSEGLFMRPQHLQQHARHVEGLISDIVESSLSYGWGFAQLELDVSELTAGKLGVGSASGVFPDGTPFRLNDSDGRPTEIDLSDTDPGSVIYLCMAPRSGGAQSQEFRKTQRSAGRVRFLTHTIDVIDNAAELAVTNDEDDQPARKAPSAQIVVGQLQTMLLTDTEESRNYVRLPLARLEENAASGGVRLDDSYIPSVTHVGASATLTQFARELYVSISTRAEQLARKVGDLGPGAEFSLNIFWLLIANRYDPLLRNILSTGIHPSGLYRLFLQMAGEFATLTEQNRRPPDFPPYSHDDLSSSFLPLIAALRESLASDVDAAVEELDLRYARQQKTWVALIKNHNILDSAEFVLAAHADIEEDELAQHLPQQMIVAPLEQIDRRVSDLRIRAAKVKPRGVPTLNRWVYFHFEQSGTTWEDLKSSRGFAFFVDRLDQDFPNLQLKFWAVP